MRNSTNGTESKNESSTFKTGVVHDGTCSGSILADCVLCTLNRITLCILLTLLDAVGCASLARRIREFYCSSAVSSVWKDEVENSDHRIIIDIDSAPCRMFFTGGERGSFLYTVANILCLACSIRLCRLQHNLGDLDIQTRR